MSGRIRTDRAGAAGGGRAAVARPDSVRPGAYIWVVTTYSAVRTTGIYCRPGCPARQPLAENVRTFEFAASAEAAGFRACLRCRPYRVASPLAPGAPELVCRAIQLIIDGVLDAGNEAALGARLAVSPRHLRRMFHDHLGVTPDQLARSRRAHFARRLLDDTELPVADVAFAAGFTSIRQFNRQMREVFGATPTELRHRRRRADRLAADGGLTMRLPFEPPLDWAAMLCFFARYAVPGVESVSGEVYRRTISLDGSPGVLEVRPGAGDHLLLRAHLPYWEGLIHVAERAGRMIGADVGAAARAPGAWGPFEAAVQAVVAQDSDGSAQARARLGGVARRFGPPVPGLTHGLTHLFPSARVLADGDLTGLDLPPATIKSLAALASCVASGEIVLDHGARRDDLVASLASVPGIEPGTAARIALRLRHGGQGPAVAWCGSGHSSRRGPPEPAPGSVTQTTWTQVAVLPAFLQNHSRADLST
jgi:AraC family transcriptional regulator of adaptative response / DNA-3-methyladenine glycosylase II